VSPWWLAFRYFGGWKSFFNLSTFLSLLGMAIGVSSLVVSMAVFSGYVSTMEKTLQDAFGHILVIKRGNGDQAAMLNDMMTVADDLQAQTPFVYAEAILAHKGKISGVLIEGIEESTVHDVLNLRSRVIAGSLNGPAENGENTTVVIGKGIAEKFALKVGDVFRLVVPLNQEFQASSFQPKMGKFVVGGIIHFGRHDFDSRYILMPLKELQSFIEIGSRITGYRLRLKMPERAREVALALTAKFGSTYWARDWQDVNRNLFEAARLEKAVLFFVLMILVVAAAFNIANTLFISVVQRFHDISILKTLGATDRFIRRIFTAQGLIVGALGAILGIVAGVLLCQLVEWIQVQWKLIPAEIYKIDHIELTVQAGDMVAIVLVSLLVCFLATLVPSRRGARISPVEGLRYE